MDSVVAAYESLLLEQTGTSVKIERVVGNDSGEDNGGLTLFPFIVHVDFLGAPETSQDVQTLEELFVSTYNENASSPSDESSPAPRQIASVAFSRIDAVRRTKNRRELARVTSTYRADVNATCRQCSSDDMPTLFRTSTASVRRLQQQGESSTSSFSLPTTTKFREDYLVAIERVKQLQKAPSTELLQNLEDVVRVREFLEMPSCRSDEDGGISQFQASIVMDLVGTDPKSIKIEEIVTLESAFVSTYNGLVSSNYCDNEQLRRAVSSTFTLESARRRLGGSGRNLQQERVSAGYKVDVNGTCRRCSKGRTTLFDVPKTEKNGTKTSSAMGSSSSSVRKNTGANPNPRNTRSLASYTGYQQHHHRHNYFNSRLRSLQATSDGIISDDCICSTNSLSANQLGPPTIDDFVNAYDTIILDLREEGILENVERVGQVDEIIPVSCDDNITPFQSSVLLDLVVIGDDPVSPSSEIGILENYFVSTYNELSENYCDGRFRRAVDSTFTLQAARRRLGGRFLKEERIAAGYKIDVNGTCRRCSNGRTTLFNLTDYSNASATSRNRGTTNTGTTSQTSSRTLGVPPP